MHRFPDDISHILPEGFNDPFRYAPHPLIRKAAEIVMDMAKDANPSGEGKMLGVLLVRDRTGRTGFLAGFSGNMDGKNLIDGFVPPIYDLLQPDGIFKKEEAAITGLNRKIQQLETSPETGMFKEELSALRRSKDADLSGLRDSMAERKRVRDRIRSRISTPQELAALVRESQHDKAEYRRRKEMWSKKEETLISRLNVMSAEVEMLKKERAVRSDRLQQWIFESYKVCNAAGEEASIREIFARQGISAPGGTGDCAAPKLLQQAYKEGLEPIAMGEFWYGKASHTAVRSHGHFYPSCTSKCGPLLGFMLKGLKMEPAPGHIHGKPVIIYEDRHLAVVSKPSGMPSVPGLDGRISMLEWLNSARQGYTAVHRLDMDTSGIMLFAKTEDAARSLRAQFENHTVSKTYIARLSPPDTPDERGFVIENILDEGSEGLISCPLGADYDERPRQKADYAHGKPASTRYKVVCNNPDGSTDIIFKPITGRTHQLRVHAAHASCLARPISGDLLYGGSTAPRLCLHSQSIRFSHPVTGDEITFETMENSYAL